MKCLVNHYSHLFIHLLLATLLSEVLAPTILSKRAFSGLETAKPLRVIDAAGIGGNRGVKESERLGLVLTDWSNFSQEYFSKNQKSDNFERWLQPFLNTKKKVSDPSNLFHKPELQLFLQLWLQKSDDNAIDLKDADVVAQINAIKASLSVYMGNEQMLVIFYKHVAHLLQVKDTVITKH
ncbi:hypothetical protein O181_034998 [Austropuccinia psidii MF-1]|uniref:RxLR effector protein n=1 Tax=Austropuccinia psidii MF-1 TaxID=1389203 RepID=A0A9Q3D6L6_9BASI|nr:hypothetical protein [Austropuccinia psidii MF-1]